MCASRKSLSSEELPQRGQMPTPPTADLPCCRAPSAHARARPRDRVAVQRNPGPLRGVHHGPRPLMRKSGLVHFRPAPAAGPLQEERGPPRGLLQSEGPASLSCVLPPRPLRARSGAGTLLRNAPAGAGPLSRRGATAAPRTRAPSGTQTPARRARVRLVRGVGRDVSSQYGGGGGGGARARQRPRTRTVAPYLAAAGCAGVHEASRIAGVCT